MAEDASENRVKREFILAILSKKMKIKNYLIHICSTINDAKNTKYQFVDLRFFFYMFLGKKLFIVTLFKSDLRLILDEVMIPVLKVYLYQ